jgi:hypothetical protein
MSPNETTEAVVISELVSVRPELEMQVVLLSSEVVFVKSTYLS